MDKLVPVKPRYQSNLDYCKKNRPIPRGPLGGEPLWFVP
jgi:hypothetical protein